jgi:pimeloyl-ACP methyl ester carboxylesterase
MSTVDVNGISLHVEELLPVDPIGTVVTIHGLAVDDLSSWYFTVACRLVEAGLRVVMYDLRGHGHSQRPQCGYHLDHHVGDLSGLLDRVAGDRPVYLLGNSFGGTVAFAYAVMNRARVAGIAAIESQLPISTPQRWKWIDGIDAGSYFPDRERGVQAVARARQMLDETSLRADLLSSELLPGSAFAELGFPILVIYGSDSPMATDVAPFVRSLLPAARYVVVPGQRHAVLVVDPGTVGDLLLSWLGVDCGLELRQAATD